MQTRHTRAKSVISVPQHLQRPEGGATRKSRPQGFKLVRRGTVDAAAGPVILANQRTLCMMVPSDRDPVKRWRRISWGLNLLQRGVVGFAPVVKSWKFLQGPSFHVLHGPIPAPERRLLPPWSVLVSAQQRIRAFRRAFMEQIAQL